MAPLRCQRGCVQKPDQSVFAALTLTAHLDLLRAPVEVPEPGVAAVGLTLSRVAGQLGHPSQRTAQLVLKVIVGLLTEPEVAVPGRPHGQVHLRTSQVRDTCAQGGEQGEDQANTKTKRGKISCIFTIKLLTIS